MANPADRIGLNRIGSNGFVLAMELWLIEIVKCGKMSRD